MHHNCIRSMWVLKLWDNSQRHNKHSRACLGLEYPTPAACGPLGSALSNSIVLYSVGFPLAMLLFIQPGRFVTYPGPLHHLIAASTSCVNSNFLSPHQISHSALSSLTKKSHQGHSIDVENDPYKQLQPYFLIYNYVQDFLTSFSGFKVLWSSQRSLKTNLTACVTLANSPTCRGENYVKPNCDPTLIRIGSIPISFSFTTLLSPQSILL